MTGLAFLLSLCCFVTAVVATAPQLPTTYHVTGNIYLPQAVVAEPFEAWVDLNKGMSRIDYYNGRKLVECVIFVYHLEKQITS